MADQSKVSFGNSVADALVLLSGLVAEAKSNAPFARITILVPSRHSGLDVTRHLARAVNGGRGLVNVHALTLGDLAADLHERASAGQARSFATPLVREAAVRSVLVEQPGQFAGVADEPATARALAAASALLDMVTPAPNVADLDLDGAITTLTREVLRVHAGVQARLSGAWFTEHDRFNTARRAVESGAMNPIALYGTMIGFLLPGAQDLDPDPRLLLEALRATLSINEVTAPSLPVAHPQLISVTDADEECRAVARLVVDRVRRGIPAHRIGVFWAAPDPYRALLHRHLADAGITVNGPAARQLPDTALVRGMSALLRLDPAAVDLRVILDVHAEGALNWSVESLPSSSACERLFGTLLHGDPDDPDEIDEPEQSMAGADGAPDDGNRRKVPTVRFVDLAEVAPDADLGAEAACDDDLVMRRQQDRQRERTDRTRTLKRYLEAVSASVAAVSRAQCWVDVAAVLDAVAAEHFAPRGLHRGVDSDSEPDRARDGLLAAIADIAGLDEVAPPPRSVAEVLATLEAALTRHPQTLNKVGVGVSLGSLHTAAARDLDVVIAVGLAEGNAPARHRDDPLVPDALRTHPGIVLPTLAERAAREQRAFHSALSSASRERIVLWPRGDLRAGGERAASRWLAALPTSAGASTPLGEAMAVGSYFDAIITGAPVVEAVPVTAQQWRLRRLHAPQLERPDAPAQPAMATAQEMRADRRLGQFSRFTGDVGAVADHIAVLDDALTASSIENWVASPLTYFLSRVLGLRLFLQIKLEVEIDVLTRGELLHAILERHTLAILDGSADTLEALQPIAERAFDEYRAMPEAVNWLEHLWQRDKRTMRTDLRLWWERRTSTGWNPHSAEAAFGMKDAAHPSLPFTLTDDSAVCFAGQIDRIDWPGADGVRVVDYKGGKSDRFAKLSQENPTAGGTKFQLPIYGLFARREAAASGRDGAVHAEYDFITRRGGQKTIGYEVTPEVIETLRADLSLVVGSIRAGVFPPVPGPSRFENFTTLIGATGMTRGWEAMVQRMPETPALQDTARLWVTANEQEA